MSTHYSCSQLSVFPNRYDDTRTYKHQLDARNLVVVKTLTLSLHYISLAARNWQVEGITRFEAYCIQVIENPERLASFYTHPENFKFGQVRSRSYCVIHDVIFGRNRPILLSIVSGRVSLLSGVCFCIAGSINGVYGYLEAIGIQLPRSQGHARSCFYGPIPQPISTVIFF